MKLGPIIQRYQTRIRIHGAQARTYKAQGMPVLAAVENENRRAAIADLTRVLRMAEQEATAYAQAIPKTHLDFLPF